MGRGNRVRSCWVQKSVSKKITQITTMDSTCTRGQWLKNAQLTFILIRYTTHNNKVTHITVSKFTFWSYSPLEVLNISILYGLDYPSTIL